MGVNLGPCRLFDIIIIIVNEAHLGERVVDEGLVGDLVQEADSVLVQGHDVLETDVVPRLPNPPDLQNRHCAEAAVPWRKRFWKSSLLTAKKLDPNSGQDDRVSRTLALARMVVSRSTSSSQLDCTMLTHCGGLMALAAKAGLGNRNLVSLMVGLWSMSAARCNKAAT